MCHKVGVVVTTYTHRSPQLNNQELPKGAVAVYGVVNPTGPFKKITEIVDKVTGKKDGVSGRAFSVFCSAYIDSIMIPSLYPRQFVL